MKIAICAICKNENLYLREWVEHHKNLGFDKIILYDNNAVDGEFPQQVIGDYIDSDYIDIYNKRGLSWNIKENGEHFQEKVYNECLNVYSKDFDWIAFIDIDEFIEIVEFKDVHNLFKYYNYNEFEQIVLSWYIIGDDGNLHYDNKPVRERFVKECATQNEDIYCKALSQYVKPIINTKTNARFGNISGMNNNPHAISFIKTCNEFGTRVSGNHYFMLNIPNYKVIYIKHYFTKSIEEFLSRRINSQQADRIVLTKRLHEFKMLNGWTTQHQKTYDNIMNYINSSNNIVDINDKKS